MYTKGAQVEDVLQEKNRKMILDKFEIQTKINRISMAVKY